MQRCVATQYKIDVRWAQIKNRRMKLNFKIVGVIFILILVSLWGWRKWNETKESMTYQDLSKQNPYESMARGTGGQVLNFDQDTVEHAAGMLVDLEKEKDFSTLWTAEGQPANDLSEFKFIVDSNISELSVFVSAIKEFPQVDIFDSSGAVVPPYKKLDSKHETKLNFQTLKPGIWRLQISSKSNVHIKIKAKASLQLASAEFVRPGGRPGHEGLFGYKGPLEKGKNEKLVIHMLGIPALEDVRVKTVSLSGRILQETKVKLKNTDNADIQTEIEIPKESFRILIEAKNKDQESFQRMHETVFNLNQKQMMEFKAHLEEPNNSDICKVLSESTHWSLLSAETGSGSAVVMCAEYQEANISQWRSTLSFHVPVSTDGTELKIRLMSANYQKLTSDDCSRALVTFKRYPGIVMNSSEYHLEWSFACEGGPHEFSGVINAVVKRK